ncbi:putative T7SS-secreted protein [Streptomyces griseorubiginosus]|uniref:putative T7SS-secreted protein n=1 Tax=Streptomyces griseorubiginosus TaxID=67304 RepID=UPI0036EBE4A1
MGVLGELGDLADGVTQGISDSVNAQADTLGDALDDVGLKSAGEKVRDGAEYLTGAVGAAVPERELGESSEPGELIHGSTGDIEEAVRHLKAFATAFENAGQALKKLDPGHWTGTAADSFRDSFTTHPKKWLTASDACTAAADALAEYAHTVTWARGQAAEAIAKWQAAEAKSSAARRTYEQQVWEYKRASLSLGSVPLPGAETPTDPGDFVDPGEAGRAEARELLKSARHTRDSAAETATTKMHSAYEAAPAEPGTWAQLKAGLMDAPLAVNMELEHFAGGFLKGGIGLTRMMRTLDPMDPHNLTHPSEYLRNVSVTGMGLLTSANHPVRTAKSMVGSGWSTDPSEAFGTAVFDVGLDLLTGGAGTGAAAARRTFTAGVKDTVETGLERGFRDGTGTTAGRAGETATERAAAGGALPDGWTIKHGGGTADTTIEPAKDGARGNWAQSHGVDGSTATGAGHPAPHPADHPSAPVEGSGRAVTFDSNAEAVRYGAEHWNDYAQSLPPDQQAAVRGYTGTEYQQVNAFLRDGDFDTEGVRRQVEHLDKALAGRPLPHDVVVARATNLEHYFREMGSRSPADMVGRDFVDKGYMSTSLGDAAFAHKEAILHLRAPEGTPGLWVEKLSHADVGERELLLGRGNKYTITKAVESDGHWHIYGEIHP